MAFLENPRNVGIMSALVAVIVFGMCYTLALDDSQRKETKEVLLKALLPAVVVSGVLGGGSWYYYNKTPSLVFDDSDFFGDTR